MAASKATDQEKTNDIFAVDILLATKLHIELNMFSLAREYYKDHSFTDIRIRPILDMMLKLVAIKMLMKDSEGLYETGFFGAGSSRLQTEGFKHLLIQMRPHMIPLVEDFPMLDTISTTIGNKWGDIYEQQLDFAKNSRLNKWKVPRYYESLMKPVMTHRKAPNL